MGDVVFRGFQCLKDECQEFIIVREDEIGPDFNVVCPACGFAHQSGGETKFFDYRLVRRDDGTVIDEGEFVTLHDDYIREAQRFKYCLLCYTRKPFEFFGVHSKRKSGRQGECRLCKTIYNGIKNQSRITDQHREAAKRRRLYKILAGDEGKIDSRRIFDKFNGTCFMCGLKMSYTETGQKEFNLDHTLPARLLWPMSTDNATLLCRDCNGKKRDRWPSEVYGVPKLKALARLTNYDYTLLSGNPSVNDDAVAEILEDIDAFIEEWIRYPEEIRKVRDLIYEYAAIDIFQNATHVPDYLRDPIE